MGAISKLCSGVEERLVSEWYGEVSGSRPDGVQEKKEIKNVQGAWVIRKRGKNGAKRRRKLAKRQHAEARNQIIFYSYSN